MKAKFLRRDVLMQAAVLGALLLAMVWLVANVQSNLERQNINSGFGFLSERAGFGINQTLIDYTEDSSFGRVLTVGLLNTLLVSVLGVFFATVLGFSLGVARLSSNWLINKTAMVYVEIFRNVPLLLQIMFWYFGVLRNLPTPRQAVSFGDAIFLSNRGIVVPAIEAGSGAEWYAAALAIGVAASIWLRRRARLALADGTMMPIWRPLLMVTVASFGVAALLAGVPFSLDVPALKGFNFRGGITVIPEFVALLLALSLYTAAFIAEIVRAGIQSVSKGQREAAAALGLPDKAALSLVVIPQALRVIIPPLTSQYLNLTKNSSLAVAIAYPDIVSVFAGTTLTQVGQAVEIIFITMMIYLSLSLLTSYAMNRYNARIALVGQDA
ncbi:ABC transporter permease subunit [Alphaproteobacteria bacterium]|nr:ABC transporter permease subunit [Alphaproteobacteria bacterium]MDA8779690.1 ABC transporter permease subunit [Alphaproteobacteria bacterium]MDA9591293.1 ABC transporter permease subunit [Alphaproteobacteria bacterium]MDB2393588.1 ABC transporter permease subunit [Alphaproteobacteria bacterium]MDB2431109.1 ABC transporter permease subunit [Alphaproteobacteria bacterium]